jgi:preprotein translocase subunit SecG
VAPSDRNDREEQRSVNPVVRWIDDWLRGGHDVPEVVLPPGPATDEVTAAVVAHVLSRPDSIRQRAQNAATISGALAAGHVVAAVSGVTNDSRSVDTLTKVLVALAIFFFALSAALSVYAVAFAHKYRRDDEQKDAVQQHPYQQLVKQYEIYADEVRQKMRWAAAASWFALALTAAALGVELGGGVPSGNKHIMSVVLSADGLRAVDKLCPGKGEPLARIHGNAPADELREAMVELAGVRLDIVRSGDAQPPPRVCIGTITVTRSAILAASFKPD